MSAESFTFGVLSASGEIHVLTSSRVFPDLAPVETPAPYVVFGRTASEPTFTIHGQLVATRVTITISCWSKQRMQAEDLGTLVVDAMASAGSYSVERRAGYDGDTDEFASIIDFDVWEP